MKRSDKEVGVPSEDCRLCLMRCQKPTRQNASHLLYA